MGYYCEKPDDLNAIFVLINKDVPHDSNSWVEKMSIKESS
ncbi:MAG: hypothetical protein UW78_C0005G0009 [Candidatus Azambacteria bacterium GW2011_GWA1_44_9]|uniref:Uncharacterized protein n=1 Tax=Candidatus Azambacteria bacterium GW2011_GWA1_44_9 TaxID=1618610 RepID=A0A0G1KE07_9BACT|nr:MAG: hypothetical protein UW78_C0005G0009 [Candidatus Azambacteria bacterium GW2011_GWA1_44_9]